jgi:hypothetical protein
MVMSLNKPIDAFQVFFSILARNRFTFLSASLFLTIGGGELLTEFNISWGLTVLMILNLLLLLSFGHGEISTWVGRILFVLFLVSAFLSDLLDLKMMAVGSQSSAAAMLILGTSVCFRVAFSGGHKVDRERISASISLYLIIGLIFTLFYALIDKALPGSFFYSVADNTLGEKPLNQLMYFSYVTLATLGYGDIVPVSGPVRGLAIMEAMIGQLYLVLVVARLVSLYSQPESN